MEISAQAARVHQEMQRMNRNLLAHIHKEMLGQHSVPAVPAVPAAAAAAAAAVDDSTGPDDNIAPIDTTAKLVEHPKTLSILWKKIMFGIERNKPEILFTPLEHNNNNNNKNCYVHRKPFWLLLGRMTNTGYDTDVACENVFPVYTLWYQVQRIFLPFFRP